jgi:hypothetical protein
MVDTIGRVRPADFRVRLRAWFGAGAAAAAQGEDHHETQTPVIRMRRRSEALLI